MSRGDDRPLCRGSQPEEIHDWHRIADDMVNFFDEEGMSHVIGIGHSLGASGGTGSTAGT